MRTIACPACKKKLKVDDRLALRNLRCGSCRHSFAPPPPLKVFISHASEDQPFIQQKIIPFLQGHDIALWYSPEDIHSGKKFEEAIYQGLELCDAFLLIMSRNSAQSVWVRKEVARAFEWGRHIIPLIIEKCDPESFHPELPKHQYEDCSGQPESALRNVLKSILQSQLQRNSDLTDANREIQQEKEESQRRVRELSRQVKALNEQIDQIAEFDGYWDRQSDQPPPPFRAFDKTTPPIVAVLNLKGGVGKSTITANLAATLGSEAQRPQRVLAVDLDYQGSLTEICLDDLKVLDLRRQKLFVQRLFQEGNARPEVAMQLLHRIEGTTGHLLAANDDLMRDENRSMVRWLSNQTTEDVRFLLRQVLHAEQFQKEFDFILLDCPPRLTTACVNALTSCDYVLIPVLLDAVSADAAPRLLAWLRQLKPRICPQLEILGILANGTSATWTMREKGIWEDLQRQCEDAWSEPVYFFKNSIRRFTEAHRARRFPALHRDLLPSFIELAQEVKQLVSRAQRKAVSHASR